MADGANPQIKIDVGLNAATSGGAQQSITDVERVQQAVVSAREQEAVAAASETAATEASAAAHASAAEIAQEYGVSLNIAGQALARVAESGASAVIGSVELETALEAVQRETVGVSAAQTEATEVAELYSVSQQTAARALEILGAGAGAATADMTALDVAMDKAQAEAVATAASVRAYNAEMTASALAMGEATAAQEEQLAISEAATAAMTRLGITEGEVSAASVKLGVSAEVAARALIQLAKARLAEQVSETVVALEALNGATVTEAETAEVAAAANTLDAEALAKRATMMRRLSDGSVDLALGGRRAVQGVADLQYVAMGLFPEGAVAIGVISGIALIGEVWESMSKKMEREHTAATNKIKGNLSEIAAATENYFRNYEMGLQRILRSQTLLEDSDKSQLAALQEKQRLTTEQMRLNEQEAIEKARQKYLVDNSNATSEDERKKLRAQFDAQVKDIKDQSNVATAQQNLDFKNQDIEAGKKTLEDLRASQAVLIRQRDEAQHGMASANNKLALHGITLNDKGEIPTGADKPAQDKVDQAQAQYDKALEFAAQQRRFQEGSGVSSEAANKNFENWIRGPLKALDDAKNELSEIHRAPGAVKTYDEAQKKLSGDISGYDQKIDAQERALDALQDAIPNLTQAINNAQRQLQSNAIETGTQVTEANRDIARSKRDRPLRQREQSLEDQLDDPTLTQGGRAQLENERKQIRGQLRRNQEADEQQDHPSSDALDKKQHGAAQGALDLAMRDVQEAGGLGNDAREKIGKFSEAKQHLQDAIAAHKDITDMVNDLIQMMANYKAGSVADRDLIRNALADLRNSPNS